MAAYQPVVRVCGAPHTSKSCDFIIVCIFVENKKCVDAVDSVCLIAELKYKGKDSQWTRSGVFSIKPSCSQSFFEI
jgi:hypothetical protein